MWYLLLPLWLAARWWPRGPLTAARKLGPALPQSAGGGGSPKVTRREPSPLPASLLCSGPCALRVGDITHRQRRGGRHRPRPCIRRPTPRAPLRRAAPPRIGRPSVLCSCAFLGGGRRALQRRGLSPVSPLHSPAPGRILFVRLRAFPSTRPRRGTSKLPATALGPASLQQVLRYLSGWVRETE